MDDEILSVQLNNRFHMDSPVLHLAPAQATDLALLVDLEARWENLRGDHSASEGKMSGTVDLKHIQKIYDAFHVKLVAYNKQYKPAHIPEVLINSSARLQAWCGRMARLFRLIQADAASPCPNHCMEKAYRCADRIADRTHKERFVRPTQPVDIVGAIQSMESLTKWCEGLVPLAA
jgi:hypothetical protein